MELREAGGAGLAFPDGEELPAEAAEGSAGAFVAGGVALDFGEPVIAAGGWDAAGSAGVGVPEAAVDEDDFFESREDEVGRAGEVFGVESVAEAEGVDEARLWMIQFIWDFVRHLHARLRTILVHIKSPAIVQHDEKSYRVSRVGMNKDHPTMRSPFNLDVWFFVVVPVLCSEQ